MSFVSSDGFASSLLVCVSFVSFSCLIAMGRNSKAMLGTGGESGHPCTVSGIGGRAFIFSPLSVMLAIG